MAGIITEERRLTLSQLQAGIKNTLAKAWGGYLWVVAEISDLKLNMSGHCYLELVEKDEDSEATLASMRGVIWKNVAADIFDTFESSTGMELSPGMKILMNCRVTYHELYGMSLSIVAIDPTYTLGERQRQRMLAIEKLKEQGLFDLNKSVTPPVVIQRIAVVSSGNAAGYRDFMQEIAANEYGFHFELTLFSAIMQGNEAEASIISALSEIESRRELFDAVVIIRGGGSTTDLSCFDNYGIAAATASMSLPVLTGIGHDKDTSVTDMVAFESLKTPTATAGWLIDRMAEFDNELYTYMEFLKTTVSDVFNDEDRKLSESAIKLRRYTDRSIADSLLSLEKLKTTLEKDALALLERQMTKCAVLEEKTRHFWETGSRQASAALESKAAALKSLSFAALKREKAKIDNLETGISTFDPKRIFALGYGLIRKAGKRGAIRSVGEVEKGQKIEMTLADGAIEASVESVTRYQTTF